MSELIEHDDGFDITAIMRLKHGSLYKAAQKLGGGRQLAEYLGVSKATVYAWINMRSCPPAEPNARMPELQHAELVAKLETLTGISYGDLFPQKLRESKDFLRANKVTERTQRVQQDALLVYAEKTQARLESNVRDPVAECNASDLKERLNTILETLLDERRAKLLRFRFGLDDGVSHTLKETAAIMDITPSRANQLEAGALRRLRGKVTTHPEVSALLIDMCKDGSADERTPLQELTHEVSLLLNGIRKQTAYRILHDFARGQDARFARFPSQDSSRIEYAHFSQYGYIIDADGSLLYRSPEDGQRYVGVRCLEWSSITAIRVRNACDRHNARMAAQPVQQTED